MRRERAGRPKKISAGHGGGLDRQLRHNLGRLDWLIETRAPEHHWPADLARRYLRSYGTRTEQLLHGASSVQDLGEDLGDGLYAAELRYLIRYEWVETAEDLLWRRSKLGLHVSDQTKLNITDWLARQGNKAARQESA